MAKQIEPVDPAGTTDPAGETPPVGDPAPVEDGQENPTPPAVEELGDLPDWAQKQIKNLRAESANYRTKFRDAETALKDAKTPEEFETARAELVTQIETLQTDLARTQLAAKYELPDDVAEILTGTPEEMETRAKALSRHIVTPVSTPPNLKGGLTPDDEEDEIDPVAAAKAALRRRYGR